MTNTDERTKLNTSLTWNLQNKKKDVEKNVKEVTKSLKRYGKKLQAKYQKIMIN